MRAAMTSVLSASLLLLLVHLPAPVRCDGSYVHEGDILLAFRQAMTDPTQKLQSWDASLSPCEWFHVTCNSENHVVRLNLGNADLEGELIPQLARLTFLERLFLNRNALSGLVPEAYGNFSQLESMDLSFNQLEGEIPSTLGNLKSLRFLSLNNNNFTGEVPLSITEISNLVVLNISGNALLHSQPQSPPPLSPSWNSEAPSQLVWSSDSISLFTFATMRRCCDLGLVILSLLWLSHPSIMQT